jgi:threonine/homoserine/homoserine lactone efflux protein
MLRPAACWQASNPYSIKEKFWKKRMKDTKQLLKITLAGIGISFCGALPFGTLNTTAMQIAIEKGCVEAFLFALGVMLIETIYLSVTLYAVDWIRKHQRLLVYAERFSVGVFLVIGGIYFYKAYYPLPPGETHTINGDYFVKGVFLSAINPAQFPFWIGWNTALFSKGLLQANERYYVSYISGVGLGTLAGLGVFVMAGNLLQQNFSLSQQYIHVIIGLVFVVCAVVQQYKGVSPQFVGDANTQVHANTNKGQDEQC